MNNQTSTPTLFQIPSIEEIYHDDANIILFPNDVNIFLSTIPNESVKLIVTSPPYNIGKEYETKTKLEKYLAYQESVIKELYRILRPDGSICWQTGNYIEKGEEYPLDMYFYPIFKSLGMKLRNRIIWRYNHGLHSQKRFSGRHETILWFTKSDTYTFNLDDVRVPAKYPGKRHYKGSKKGKLSGNPKGKNPSNVWEIIAKEWAESFIDIPNVKASHREKTPHPAQYPIELVERCVLALTNEEDWVFDPYAGAGSSLIAAIKNNRRVMGCEKEEKYVEIAKKRMADFFNGTLRMRPLGKPIYKPRNERVAKYPDEWKAKKEKEQNPQLSLPL